MITSWTEYTYIFKLELWAVSWSQIVHLLLWSFQLMKCIQLDWFYYHHWHKCFLLKHELDFNCMNLFQVLCKSMHILNKNCLYILILCFKRTDLVMLRSNVRTSHQIEFILYVNMKYTFFIKNDGEKQSRFFFEIQTANLELLLPRAKKFAQKGWIGLSLKRSLNFKTF